MALLRVCRPTVVGMLSLLCVLSCSPAAEKPPVPAPPARVELSEADWPEWRGSSGDGSAPEDGGVPLTWSDQSGVAWQAPLPGRGHGSPIVVGDQVIVTTADHSTEQQSVFSFHRLSGGQQWQSVIHEGGFATKMNSKATLASSTPACDGERIFVNFVNDGAVWTTALNLHGEQLWQTRISDYVIHQGYGSSPEIHQSLVIVAADNKGGGAVAALRRDDGTIAWRHERPDEPNYSSPVVVHADGQDQLILTGCDRVQSFNPLTGDELWQVAGATTECVTTTVTDGRHVFSSGGYPRNHIAAYRADGSGTVVWEDTTRVYVPSMLLRDGLLFGVTDAGVAFCRRSDDGEPLWRGRLSGTFSSSPVLVGDRIYATNEAGRTFVFRATDDAFEQLGSSQLGDEVFATPAVSRGCLFQRIARGAGADRKEFLVCIGQP